MTNNHSTHRWSGWPGAWCLVCGQEDWQELDCAGLDESEWKPLDRQCPGYKGTDPYKNELESNNK